MPATAPAPVNPNVLVWARQEAGYSVPDLVAKRLNVKPERLISWERGERQPSLRQAKELARVYHRPFGVFFLASPPNVRPLASEYRRLPGIEPGVESPELRLAIRVMSLRRDAALDLGNQLGIEAEDAKITARLDESPTLVGQRLRKVLGITPQQQFDWQNEWQAWKEWRTAVEAAGILVFQFPKVPLEEARGISLLEFPLSVIGINSKEMSPAARSYSLLHELVHIALARAQQEKPASEEKRTDEEWQSLERFAEETASAILIPEEELTLILERFVRPAPEWTVDAVRTLARRFRITPLAMATRLRARGDMNWPEYARWKLKWADYVASLPPRKGGFSTPIGKTLGRSGEPFVKLVISALDANRVTAYDASRLLDLGFGHFDKLREALRPHPGGALRESTE